MSAPQILVSTEDAKTELINLFVTARLDMEENDVKLKLTNVVRTLVNMVDFVMIC